MDTTESRRNKEGFKYTAEALARAAEVMDEAKAYFEKKGYRVFAVSAVTRAGTKELINAIGAELARLRSGQEQQETPFS